MGIKLLVVSDSHGNTVRLERIIRAEIPFDYLIHCGDGAGDLMRVSLPRDVPVLRVSGNIDLARGMDLERRIIEKIGTFTFMITHGDLQGVHRDTLGLLDEGRARRCDIILFGHTHRPYQSGGKPVLFNPGAALNGFYGVILLNGAPGIYQKSVP